MNKTQDKIEEPNFEEIMSNMPIEKFDIETADHLFKKDGKSKNLRIVYLPKTEEQRAKGIKDTVLIIINNALALWFFKGEDGWKYDGWEMGNYTEEWIDKNL